MSGFRHTVSNPREGAGTHTGHTGARAHGSHRRTSQPSKPTNTPAPRAHDRATVCPRPTQQPQPRSRTLPNGTGTGIDVAE